MLDALQIREVLKHVLDPELGVNIVDLGLVYKVQPKENGEVYIEMTLTTPGCPMHDTIVGGVKRVLQDQFNVEAEVEVVWDPPWSPDHVSEEGREMLGFF